MVLGRLAEQAFVGVAGDVVERPSATLADTEHRA